jgi:hypothetical protein
MSLLLNFVFILHAYLSLKLEHTPNMSNETAKDPPENLVADLRDFVEDKVLADLDARIGIAKAGFSRIAKDKNMGGKERSTKLQLFGNVLMDNLLKILKTEGALKRLVKTASGKYVHNLDVVARCYKQSLATHATQPFSKL